MNNAIKYNGIDIENGEKVIEAVVDNLVVYIIKQDENYIAKLIEQNYDSVIEYEDYILDIHEIDMMDDRESCYNFIIEFFHQYCCSYGMM